MRKQLLRQHFQEEAQRRLLSELWEISRGAKSLDEADQNRLFCLLAAGYSLAEKTPKECPISSKDAENGFLNRVEVPRAESWVVIPDDGDICLEARREPYRILSAAKTMRFLPLGTCISQRKFVATPHAQQAAGIPVTLQVYAGEQDQNPTMLRIAVGDYLYTNFAGNTPIWFHPAVQESGACKIERKKTQITYTDKRNKHIELLQSPDVEPVGFAAEQTDAGWILMYNGKLDISTYSGRHRYQIHTKDIVQVEFRGAQCLLLDKMGTVYTNFGGEYPNRLISLDKFTDEMEDMV